MNFRYLLLAPILTFAFGGCYSKLMKASRTGDLPEVRRLIASGKNVNYQAIWASEPAVNNALQIAAKYGRTEVVGELLAAGADPDGKGKDGMMPGSTPIGLAVAGGHDEAVLILLEAGANPNYGVYAPLYYAIRRNSPSAVRMLLEHGASVNRGVPGWLVRRYRPSHPIDQGVTWLDFARITGKHKAARALATAGGVASNQPRKKKKSFLKKALISGAAGAVMGKALSNSGVSSDKAVEFGARMTKDVYNNDTSSMQEGLAKERAAESARRRAAMEEARAQNAPADAGRKTLEFKYDCPG